MLGNHHPRSWEPLFFLLATTSWQHGFSSPVPLGWILLMKLVDMLFSLAWVNLAPWHCLACLACLAALG